MPREKKNNILNLLDVRDASKIRLILQELLAESHADNISGIAIAAISSDGHALTSVAGYTGNRNILMNGMLVNLIFEINHRIQN